MTLNALSMGFLRALLALGIFYTLQPMNLLRASEAQANDATLQNLLLRTLIDDMTRPGDGQPRGVKPTTTWVHHGRLNWANDPHGFRALMAWGQIYRDINDPAGDTNTRIAIRDIQLWVLSKSTNRWNLLQHTNKVRGGAYYEDFRNNFNKPANLRNEPDGGISVRLEDGFNFHFWATQSRATIDPNDISGILSAYWVRLVPDDFSKPADFMNAMYLAGAGADYWKDTSAKWDNYKTNADAAIGRFKRITQDWKLVTMSTLTEKDWKRLPLPTSDLLFGRQ